MISEHNRTVSSDEWINGKHSYQILLKPSFHSRPMVRMFQNPKMVDDGTLKLLILKVHIRFELPIFF